MFLYPGQGTQKFMVKRARASVSDSGRPKALSYDTVCEFFGVLTSAQPKEQEQWRQSGHPVTHKVVQPLPKEPEITVKGGDLLILNGRVFTIQGVRNPGELNHFNVYYCEERRDIKNV